MRCSTVRPLLFYKDPGAGLTTTPGLCTHRQPAYPVCAQAVAGAQVVAGAHTVSQPTRMCPVDLESPVLLLHLFDSQGSITARKTNVQEEVGQKGLGIALIFLKPGSNPKTISPHFFQFVAAYFASPSCLTASQCFFSGDISPFLIV